MSHMAQTERHFLNPSGLYTFSLCLATTFCLSLVLPSLFSPFSDSQGPLPVYVRRASSQSAVKAVILLVAIYYPVVCLKKDWKRAKLGAVLLSKQTRKAPISVHNWPAIHLSLCAHESLCSCKHTYKCGFFALSDSLCGAFVYLLIAFFTAQWVLHADIFLLPLRAGMCWFGSFEDNKAAWGGCV